MVSVAYVVLAEYAVLQQERKVLRVRPAADARATQHISFTIVVVVDVIHEKVTVRVFAIRQRYALDRVAPEQRN
jgi:hypothetical protein